jgi:hypothetical protein
MPNRTLFNKHLNSLPRCPAPGIAACGRRSRPCREDSPIFHGSRNTAHGPHLYADSSVSLQLLAVNCRLSAVLPIFAPSYPVRFQTNTNCPVCKPFVLITIQIARGVGIPQCPGHLKYYFKSQLSDRRFAWYLGAPIRRRRVRSKIPALPGRFFHLPRFTGHVLTGILLPFPTCKPSNLQRANVLTYLGSPHPCRVFFGMRAGILRSSTVHGTRFTGHALTARGLGAKNAHLPKRGHGS